MQTKQIKNSGGFCPFYVPQIAYFYTNIWSRLVINKEALPYLKTFTSTTPMVEKWLRLHSQSPICFISMWDLVFQAVAPGIYIRRSELLYLVSECDRLPTQSIVPAHFVSFSFWYFLCCFRVIPVHLQHKILMLKI